MLSHIGTNQMPLISGLKMSELPGLRRWRLWRLISNCLVLLLDRYLGIQVFRYLFVVGQGEAALQATEHRAVTR